MMKKILLAEKQRQAEKDIEEARLNIAMLQREKQAIHKVRALQREERTALDTSVALLDQQLCQQKLRIDRKTKQIEEMTTLVVAQEDKIRKEYDQ